MDMALPVISRDCIITIPPGDDALLTFSRHGFSAILLYLPDDVRPYFRIDKIQIGDWVVPDPDPLAGQLIEIDIQIGAWADVIVRLTNVSARSRDLHVIPPSLSQPIASPSRRPFWYGAAELGIGVCLLDVWLWSDLHAPSRLRNR